MGVGRVGTSVPVFLTYLVCTAFIACAPAASGDGADAEQSGGSSDEGGAAPWRPDPADRQIEPLPPATDSTTACRVDEDCTTGAFCMMGLCSSECDSAVACAPDETCSARGQCLQAPSAPGEPPPIVELGSGRIVRESDAVALVIAPGQSEVALVFDVELDDTSDELAFRLDRDDGLVEGRRSYQVERLGPGRHELVVETGSADPLAASPRAVQLELVTTEGTVFWSLQPELSLSGAWLADARIAASGGASVEVPFDLRVEPADAQLEDADAVWLGWPTGGEFYGVSGIADGDWVELPMTFDDVQRTWIAQVESAYTQASAAVSPAPEGTIGRSLRIELRQQGLALRGRIVDRWTGLYEFRTVDGQRQASSDGAEASVDARRVAASPHSETYSSRASLPRLSEEAWSLTDGNACSTTIDTVLCIAGYTTQTIGDAELADAVQCAVEFAEELVENEGVGATLVDYFEGDGDSGQSFAEFMQACERGTNGECESNPASPCAIELLAGLLVDAGTTDLQRRELVDAAASLARASSVGPRLRIFGTAMRLRADWLRQTAWPTFAASAIRAATEGRIAEWHNDVVQEHGAIFELGWTAASLVLMGQELGGEDGSDVRARHAMEVSQSWAATIDAIAVEAERWHVTLQDGDARRLQHERLRGELFRRYVQGLALSGLNQSAGVGWISEAMWNGFGRAWTSVERLRLSLRTAIFERDGEVVLSGSVGSSSGLDALLLGRQSMAMNAVQQARAQTDSVLAELQAEALRESDLSARFDQNASSLLQELAELCGKPEECAVLDPADPACNVPVDTGSCGLGDSALGSGDVRADDASEAGRALLAIQQAALGIREADAALELHLGTLDLQYAELNAQATEIEEWNLLRMEGILVTRNLLGGIAEQRRSALSALELNLLDQQLVRDEGIAERMALMGQQEGLAADELGYSAAEIAARRSLRDALVRMGEQNIAGWNRIVVQGVESDYQSQLAEIQERHKQDLARRTADASVRAAGGLFNGITSFLGGNMVGVIGSALDVASAGASLIGGWDREANRMAAAREREAALRNAELNLAREDAAIEQMRISNEIENLAELAQLDRQRRGIALQQIDNDIVRSREAETYRLAQLQGAGQVDQREYELRVAELQADVQLAQLELQAELAYREQLSQFRARQVGFQTELNRVAEFELRGIRAELALQQSIATYVSIVDRAQFGSARLERVQAQRINVAMLVGSPDAIFQRAATLERAEQAMSEARRAMLDWLIAIEHYAVRPFASQRAVILLTTSVDELEAVATELERLSARCGGAWNRRLEEISVRDSALGLGASILDSTTGEVISPAARLRSVLASGYIDVDGRTRYRTERTVEDLLARGDFWGATFGVDISDFANLASTCNARVVSVAVELVGDLGTGSPTVTLIHDGQGSLRSCQPDISELVESLGAQTSSYGSTTVVRTAPRSISPVSGVNELPDAAEFNTSWNGMPLASRYTLLVDMDAGQNAALNWNALEDIVLAVEYEYQDVFSVGACN